MGKRSLKVRAAAAALALTLVWPQAAAGSGLAQFTDTAGHWAEHTIGNLVDQGILDGFPDGTFRPDEPVKVDQFFKMLLLMQTQLHPNGARTWQNGFLDALSLEQRNLLLQDYREFTFKPNPVGYWAKMFISIASDLNFLNKSRYSDFQAELRRENVAEILYYTLYEIEYLEDEAFSQALANSVTDLRSASERERKFIGEVYAKGIMEGYPDGAFGVGRSVTRAEALAILSRLNDRSRRIDTGVPDDLPYRVVPTRDGNYKKVLFPDQRMWAAYDILHEAGQLRGTNYDLTETTLRLYRDREEKQAALNPVPGTAPVTEETAIWLEPEYRTYGITVSLREGTLARNLEAIRSFANYLFGYEAKLFHDLFDQTAAAVAGGSTLEPAASVIGAYRVDVRTEGADTVIFSIAPKA